MKPADRKIVWISVGLFVAVLGVAIPVMYLADAEGTPHAKPPAAPNGEINCPYEFSSLTFHDHTASCWCNGDYGWREVAIGTGQYHEHSDPCAAAVHAGALSRLDARRMTFEQTAGCAAYTGTEFNRMKSMSLQDTSHASYIVSGHGHPGCSQSFNF